MAARLAALAEYVEVAHRVGGVDAARDMARHRRGKQFDPALSDLMCDEGEMILSGLDEVGTWDAVIDAEPALAVVVGPGQLDDALRAVANFVDLKSPYSLGHAGAVADLAADAGQRLGLGGDDVPPCDGPGWSTDSGGWASRTRSGTSPGRSGAASGSACACTRT